MFDINTCTLIPAHKTKPKHKFPLPGRRSPWKEREIQWNSGPVEVDGNFATDCSTQEPSLQTCKEFSNRIVIYAGEDDNTTGKIWCLDKWTIDTASAYIFSTKATSGHLSCKDREACERKEQKKPFFCPYAHMLICVICWAGLNPAWVFMVTLQRLCFSSDNHRWWGLPLTCTFVF